MNNTNRAYSEDEIDTIWWFSKRFDYFSMACCIVAFIFKVAIPESSHWKFFVLIALPFVVWSGFATLGASGNLRLWIPFLSALTVWRSNKSFFRKSD